MKRHLTITLTILLLTSLILTACSDAATPETAPDPEEADVAQVEATSTQVPTFTPTSPPPTETPTKAPPTATATLVLTATPTPIPSPTPQIYLVQQGDTLLDIAIQFGTTTETLEALNGINETDFLQLGQEIVLPDVSESSETTEVAAETDAATPESDTITTEPSTETQPVEPTTEPATETVVEAAPAPPPASSFTYDGPPLPAVSHPANVNPLTGLPVADPSVLQRRPLLVRIGNDSAARQSQIGLNSADLVYEEIAEWWVTRFTAIFLSQTPDTVGPVRSARLINVQLAPQYQGALAHSGGSDGVRWEISQAPIPNLDEFYNPAPYFYRENEGWQTRLAINSQSARNYMVSRGLEAGVTQQGFVFSEGIDRGEAGETIYIPYPQVTSFTEWRYDAASGKYLRWIDGAPLIDAADGQQVSASNVVIYFAVHGETDIVEDANGMTSIRTFVNGQGKAWFFRDGKLNTGFWLSDGSRTPYFTYEDGSAYPLKPGNTFFEVVPDYYTIGLNSAEEASSRP
ncbi:MAG: DUF3048 domain-containing protein [Chloroflexota bacterium]